MNSVIFLLCCCLFHVSAQTTTTTGNVTVNSLNSSLVYAGQWIPQDNGGHEFTRDPNASVSLTFQGTAVYWHSRKNPVGGISNVFLDNALAATIDPSLGFTNINETAVPAILFAKAGLPDGSHTVKVGYAGIGSLGGSYVESYYFEYTQGSTGGSSTSGTTPTATAASSPSAKMPALVGGLSALGVVIAACLIGALVFFLRKRQRTLQQGKEESRAQTAEPYTFTPGSSSIGGQSHLTNHPGLNSHRSGHPISPGMDSPLSSGAQFSPSGRVIPATARREKASTASVPTTASSSLPHPSPQTQDVSTDHLSDISGPPPAYS